MIPKTPTPYQLQVRSQVEVGESDFGNPIYGWSQPRTWLAYGIAPGAMTEGDEQNRDLSIVAWTIYGPIDGAPTSPHDEVKLPGDSTWLQVNGTPEPWHQDPWRDIEDDVVVELKRADG